MRAAVVCTNPFHSPGPASIDQNDGVKHNTIVVAGVTSARKPIKHCLRNMTIFAELTVLRIRPLCIGVNDSLRAQRREGFIGLYC